MSQNIPAQVQAADYAAPGKSFTGGIATLKRHHTWRDGDFSLISSDFVVFKVSSRILQAVRYVSHKPYLLLPSPFRLSVPSAPSAVKY